MPVALLLHVPPDTKSVTVDDEPIQTSPSPIMFPGSESTEIIVVAIPQSVV